MAFLTLELHTKGKTCLIPPNDPNDTKKIYKIGISYILAFHLAFATFIGLFQFFWGPWSLRSPVACSSDLSDPFIIKKNYCWKFPILNHCDLEPSWIHLACPTPVYSYCFISLLILFEEDVCTFLIFSYTFIGQQLLLKWFCSNLSEIAY